MENDIQQGGPPPAAENNGTGSGASPTPDKTDSVGTASGSRTDSETPLASGEAANEGFDIFNIRGVVGGQRNTSSDTGRVNNERTTQPRTPKPFATPKSKFGGDRNVAVPQGLGELFTKDGFGEVVVEGLNSFYKYCEAPTFDDNEKKITKEVVAYYAQMRFPEDLTQFQPEVLLIIALGLPLLRRMEPVQKKTAPLFKKWAEGIIGLFRKKDRTQVAESKA